MTVEAVRPGPAPYAPISACGRGCLPRPGATPLAAWPVRILRLAALVVVLLGGIAVALLTPVLSRSARARTKRGWFRALLRASGVRLRVVGGGLSVGSSPGTLITANHVSWLNAAKLIVRVWHCLEKL